MNASLQRYADDAPITTAAEDRFGRWPFAERIAQVLARHTDTSSIVVGLYGPWGDGKTSVLNMMHSALRNAPGLACVRFNPWLLDGQGNLARALCDTIAASYDGAVGGTSEEARTCLSLYGRSLAAACAISNLAARADETRDEEGTAVSLANLQALKEKVSESLVRSGRRTIVLIDDVDRLDRAGIHDLLKLVNLTASFATVLYVLALDADVVASALGERYGVDGPDAGRQFLEKIIQVPLHLPDAEGADLQAACLDGIDNVINENRLPLSDADADLFVRHFVRGLVPALRTPRQVKRFLNAVRFAVPMVAGEVHLLDQLLIEALRIIYPGVYLCVRDHEEIFTGQRLLNAEEVGGQKKTVTAVVESGLAGLSQAHRDSALYVLKTLFPRLNSVFGNTVYSAEWNDTWDRERRITAPDYFRRYFQYSVPRRDVSDASVARLIDACRSNRETEIEAFFATLRERDAWLAGYQKLQAQLPALQANVLTTLVRAIARHADVITGSSARFAAGAVAARRAAALVADAIAGIGDVGTKAIAAGAVMTESTSLAFAAQCFRIVTSDDDRPAVLPPETARDVGAILAERIAAACANEVAFEGFGSNTADLLAIWKKYGSEGASQVSEFLEGRFAKYPEAVVPFLNAFLRSDAPGGTLSAEAAFGRREFDAVASLVRPAIVADLLRPHVDVPPEQLTFETIHELEIQKRTAAQFLLIYRKVVAGPSWLMTS